MVLLVRLEMLRQLRETLAQQSNLNFWRSSVGFMSLMIGKNLPFDLYRQCHSRVAAPCLLLSRCRYRNQNSIKPGWAAVEVSSERPGAPVSAERRRAVSRGWRRTP